MLAPLATIFQVVQCQFLDVFRNEITYLSAQDFETEYGFRAPSRSSESSRAEARFISNNLLVCMHRFLGDGPTRKRYRYRL